MRGALVAPLMLAVMATGCAPQDDDETRPGAALGAAPATSPAPTVLPKAGDVDPVLRLGPKHSGDRVGVFVPRPVDEAAASSAAALDAAALTDTQWEVVGRSPVPVLLPGDAGLTSAARLSAGPHWYAASMITPDHSVYIQGSRGAYEHDQVALDAPGDALTARPYTITRIHQILTLSFERFGVSYAIDVECQRPMDDPKCVEDGYAVGLYESALVARGGVR